MDEKDLELISLLRRNAGAPIGSLARHIRLPRNATQHRLARQEGSGALAGYTFVQGSPRAIAQSAPLRARSESGKTRNQFALRVKAILFVMRIDSLAAEIDLLVSIDADSIESVEDMRRKSLPFPASRPLPPRWSCVTICV
ncbi:Lrp/AsnC family transcriptional regulator [Sinorhizobium medicae]|uniref:Lrp/AsnC family transcriptional regulator n=1 Tax=Sinorhizobium medicae TaxID=110321 RepID=UPI001F3FACE4|nr:Lrp/AsnC family transcriptional regulator [Sinorhizobium medicae]